MGEAILALTTAIIGGFIGAFLNSHTDRQGRMFDRRSVLFGDFLTKIHSAIESLYENVKENYAIRIEDGKWKEEVTKHFFPVYNSERIIRLFLFEKDREAFTEAFNRAISKIEKYPRNQLGYLKAYKNIDEIEKIFLSNLKPEPFYAPLFMKFEKIVVKLKTEFRK